MKSIVANWSNPSKIHNKLEIFNLLYECGELGEKGYFLKKEKEQRKDIGGFFFKYLPFLSSYLIPNIFLIPSFV